MIQSKFFDENKDDDFYPAGSETIVEDSIIRKTECLTVPMKYKHMMISFEKLQSYVMEGRELRCQHGKKPCNSFGRCYSCPPLSPTLERYNTGNYRNVLVYTFYAELIPFKKADRIFIRQNAHRTLSPVARNYARILEKFIGGKVAFDGGCQKCNPCNATKTPREPCKNFQDLRCSLESLGINVVNLCKEVLQHQIFWWGKEEPPYLSVCHGLLTNNLEPRRMFECQLFC